MGNEELIEYMVKSVYRDLIKRNNLYKFETVFLGFIKKRLPKASSKKELAEEFKLLKKNIEVVTNNDYERKSLDYFDFISWLESAISGKTFAEIVKEKAQGMSQKS